MNSCDFPSTVRACSFKHLLNSISMAPPPGTTAAFFVARRTISIASFKLLAAPQWNCSALRPRKTKVHVFASAHPRKTLKRSEPTCISSNTSHVPNCSSFKSFTVVCTAAPVARVHLSKSPVRLSRHKTSLGRRSIA